MKKNIGAKLGLYPTPVVVVGTYGKDGKPNLITLAWVGVCCSEPPCVQVSLQKARYSHEAIVTRKAFSVNVPSAKYVAETDYSGIASGRNADKFAAAKLTPVKGEILDVPMVLEFPVSMECRLTHTLELGSHDLFVGEIAACWIEEAALGENGRPSIKEIDAMSYAIGGEYFRLGDFLAPGFSAGKKFLDGGKK